MRRLRDHEVNGNLLREISPTASGGAASPTGLRTATAQWATPRIITPSRTAWPPTGASRWAVSRPASAPPRFIWPLGAGRSARGGAGVAPALGHAALEALDASAGVYELLATR